MPPDVAILIDKGKQSYRALDLRRGIGATFSAATLQAGRRAWAGGFRQTRTQGDPWQQGGVLVVDTDGAVLFVQRSESAGDHPAPRDVLAALP